jgi:hypothetical protein
MQQIVPGGWAAVGGGRGWNGRQMLIRLACAPGLEAIKKESAVRLRIAALCVSAAPVPPPPPCVQRRLRPRFDPLLFAAPKNKAASRAPGPLTVRGSKIVEI